MKSHGVGFLIWGHFDVGLGCGFGIVGLGKGWDPRMRLGSAGARAIAGQAVITGEFEAAAEVAAGG